jgi:mannose/fructose/N-acetylgalactosamine-specific phosphotransferase system component IID
MMRRVRSLIRLLSLQASFTFERLQGVGMAVAEEPLLESLSQDPEQMRVARGRSAQYFNAHPFLAGIAAGALAKAELDREDGERILRLRTALSGPLGALGDQLFWAGIVPAIMGVMLAASALGGGLQALIGIVIGYNITRVFVTAWGLQFGFSYGIGVASEISHTRLKELASAAGSLSAVVIGGAIPWVALWLLEGAARARLLGLLLVGAAIVVGMLTRRRPISAPLVTLGAGLVVLLWRWSLG